MNNLRTSPLSSCKNLPPIFFMVHLLHRLYGVDAPVLWCHKQEQYSRTGRIYRVQWRHRIYGHDTFAILWVLYYNLA